MPDELLLLLEKVEKTSTPNNALVYVAIEYGRERSCSDGAL